MQTIQTLPSAMSVITRAMVRAGITSRQYQTKKQHYKGCGKVKKTTSKFSRKWTKLNAEPLTSDLVRTVVLQQGKIGDNILLKPNVIDWCLPNSKFVSTLTVAKEKQWGTRVIGYTTNQWTTKCGESILEETLMRLGKNPVRIRDKKQGENGKCLVPDFETDEALYECKARTYTTTGTAGEKILGTPWKYSDCYKLYKKPLYIVCMAYQEKEAVEEFKLFDTKSPVRRRILQCFEKDANVTFIKFTDLLKMIVNKHT